jgi:cysteine-S-conjugate beta-lyase
MNLMTKGFTMVYDFDTEIDRMPTSAYKWSFMKEITGLEDLFPLWVADMDFACSPDIVKALSERVAHPIYGYTGPTDGYHSGLINWMDKRHGWKGIEKEWVTYTPGVVSGFSLAIQAYSQPGDKVVIQPPVYYPFKNQILANGRQVVDNPLKVVDGRYKMDFEDLEKKIDDNTRMIILCSPHNPIGRVWEREELEKLVKICIEKDIVIISDEIHNDLIFGDIKHTPTATISKEAMDRTVTLVAVSKTFNLAGMSTANAIIPNSKLRAMFQAAAGKSALHNNLIGIIAQDAAYNYGEPWLEELLVYIKGNLEYFEKFFAEKLPGFKVFPLEGTYLTWVDCTTMGLNDEKLNDFMLKDAKLWLDEGTLFGAEGSMFMRFNLACPRSILVRALDSLEKAVKEHQSS